MSKKDQLELVLVSQPDWLGTQISCKAELQLKKNPWVVGGWVDRWGCWRNEKYGIAQHQDGLSWAND